MAGGPQTPPGGRLAQAGQLRRSGARRLRPGRVRSRLRAVDRRAPQRTPVRSRRDDDRPCHGRRPIARGVDAADGHRPLPRRGVGVARRVAGRRRAVAEVPGRSHRRPHVEGAHRHVHGLSRDPRRRDRRIAQQRARAVGRSRHHDRRRHASARRCRPDRDRVPQAVHRHLRPAVLQRVVRAVAIRFVDVDRGAPGPTGGVARRAHGAETVGALPDRGRVAPGVERHLRSVAVAEADRTGPPSAGRATPRPNLVLVVDPDRKRVALGVDGYAQTGEAHPSHGPGPADRDRGAPRRVGRTACRPHDGIAERCIRPPDGGGAPVPVHDDLRVVGALAGIGDPDRLAPGSADRSRRRPEDPVGQPDRRGVPLLVACDVRTARRLIVTGDVDRIAPFAIPSVRRLHHDVVTDLSVPDDAGVPLLVDRQLRPTQGVLPVTRQRRDDVALRRPLPVDGPARGPQRDPRGAGLRPDGGHVAAPVDPELKAMRLLADRRQGGRGAPRSAGRPARCLDDEVRLPEPPARRFANPGHGRVALSVDHHARPQAVATAARR
ncbi:hypothetical protein PAI11_42420 [Patulibacter medicamentivorans]|uniref:Uncharacterized protein n=1 Tax=Patulibacter medicamentivorans TaxID=1097667 RepID=H0EBL0_9ACTN|nr:hypothetical protein PAI11_42420 [Patulibacter medicamentivorans]